MNKFANVLLLGAALSLAACGGDSDSSGDSNNNEVIPSQFQGLPSCAIEGDFLIEQDFFIVDRTTNDNPTCLVKVPDLNNGRTFSLSCSDNFLNDSTTFSIEVGGDSRDDLDSIRDDFQAFREYLEDDDATTSTSKYGYLCN